MHLGESCVQPVWIQVNNRNSQPQLGRTAVCLVDYEPAALQFKEKNTARALLGSITNLEGASRHGTARVSP